MTSLLHWNRKEGEGVMFDVSSLGKHNCHETSRSKVNSKMEQAISFQLLGDSDLAGCQSRKGLQAEIAMKQMALCSTAVSPHHSFKDMGSKSSPHLLMPDR